jgi:hypothetical protein
MRRVSGIWCFQRYSRRHPSTSVNPHGIARGPSGLCQANYVLKSLHLQARGDPFPVPLDLEHTHTLQSAFVSLRRCAVVPSWPEGKIWLAICGSVRTWAYNPLNLGSSVRISRRRVERIMGTYFAGAGPRRKSILKAILAVTLTGAVCVPLWSAQSQTPDWQAAAGGNMVFDTASVHESATA